MKELTIPITERSMEYGYIFWYYRIDEEVKNFLGDTSTINLVVDDIPYGKKNIDWKERRIFVGARWMRELSHNVDTFVLTRKDPNTVHLTCR